MDKRKRKLESREIEKIPSTPQLFPELVTALTELCFVRDNPAPVDLIFVFGSNVRHRELAELICELLQQNVSKKIIITGGTADYEHSYFEDTAESQQILSHISCDDFPGISFLTESVSKNSLENVLEAARIFDFSKVQSVLFISHSYASRRSRLTMRRICPEAELLSYPFDIPIPGASGIMISSNDWWETESGKSVVWGEYLRFVAYGGRGDFPIDEIQGQLNRIGELTAKKRGYKKTS